MKTLVKINGIEFMYLHREIENDKSTQTGYTEAEALALETAGEAVLIPFEGSYLEQLKIEDQERSWRNAEIKALDWEMLRELEQLLPAENELKAHRQALRDYLNDPQKVAKKERPTRG